jgi:methionyl-tRNA formyltransferase
LTKRVLFLGSPEFAIPSLRALCDDSRIDVGLVVSQPDRPTGRGRRLTPPPVARFALERGLPLFQPETLKQDDAGDRLAAERADALVVVAYGEILSKSILNLASAGALNVHPSLLPRYRGSSPISTAILNGDTQTGVSIIKLVRRLDAGPIVMTRSEPILSEDTTETLSARLANVAAEILPETVSDWIDGRLPARDQNDAEATYTHEWSKDDARIDWTKPAVEIERLVRAAIPWPVAWTTLDAVRLQIREAAVSDELDETLRPGTVFSLGKHVNVQTGFGYLRLVTVQPESKKSMPALTWWKNLTDSFTHAVFE